LSFFDEGDERVAGATRAPRAPRPPGGGGGGGAMSDSQTLMVRRAVAAGVGLLVLILLVLLVRSCVENQKIGALKSYTRDVNSIREESQSQVSGPLFSLLGKTRSADSAYNQINEFRVTAQEEAKRAANLNVPGDMSGAQRALLLELNLRTEAITAIAGRIRGALVAPGAGGGNTAQESVNAIAAEMQAFLASDVIDQARVMPLMQQALNDNGVHSEAPTPGRNFLPDLSWLDPTTVSAKLGAGGAAKPSGPVAPGSHGHTLNGVSAGGQDLQESPAVNRISGASNPTFTAKFSNTGTNDESNVKVDIAVTGSGKPLSATKTVVSSKAGTDTSIDIPLGAAAPTGVPLHVQASVEPVPGETVVDNNKKTYTVVFSK